MTAQTEQPPVRKSRAGRDLPAALAVGISLFTYSVLTILYWPVGLILLLVVLMTLGAIEVHQALQRIGMHSAIVPIVVGTIAIIGGSYTAAVLQPVTNVPWASVLLALLGGTVMLALIWRMPKGSDGFVKDASASLFIISYIPLLGSFVGLILAAPNGAMKAATAFLCVAASDTGGYAVGATLGKHPMAPAISPKKTWEGMAGSVGLAVLVGILMGVYVLGQPWWIGLVLALVVVGFGTAGDLIESLIKRDVGIKDMSSFLPGHGGVMDRLDSILVASPAAWLVYYLLVPGS